jgi:hypothetical protein
MFGHWIELGIITYGQAIVNHKGHQFRFQNQQLYLSVTWNQSEDSNYPHDSLSRQFMSMTCMDSIHIIKTYE